MTYDTVVVRVYTITVLTLISSVFLCVYCIKKAWQPNPRHYPEENGARLALHASSEQSYIIFYTIYTQYHHITIIISIIYHMGDDEKKREG